MTETRALLLTDVVDSTQLSEQLGDLAMAALWAAHDAVARDLLVPHRGREIDKTDGFLLLFDAAADAVAYALAYHRALRALEPPLTARAGLHVGDVILTENAPDVVARGAKPLEVDGVAKPTGARVMSVASGGQTLLTDAARQSLGRTTLRLQSHGHWRMKGIAEPIELFEVGDADAPFAPPPDGAKVYRVVEQGDLWLPVKQVKHSLPAERDAFVGRQADLTTLARRLDGGARLVSVLGIGGTGKTRLVTRYGWSWLGDYPGGVWFCDLSEARGVDGICHGVARALDVPLGSGDPVVQLGHAIAGRGRCLLLLDNFEQVARHADDTVGPWLDRAGEAQFVVTTREVLGLPGEDTLALAPLPIAEGAALFVARARSAKRDFEPDDVASIDALVKLLDGLPLAIELAAARVRLMPPAKLLERMSQRFKLLTSSGGRRDRQATLKATLDWSWELLSADEQAALAQVSVFEGGFTVEAAEAVLELDEAWPMDAVQALVDKSLVRQVSDDRLDLLVSVQEYASQALDGLGARQDTVARHGRHFATYGAVAAVDALDGQDGTARWQALSADLDNLLAACWRAAARADAPVAAATLRAAWAVLERRGPFDRAAVLATEVIRRVGTDGARAVAHLVAGRANSDLGRLEAARGHYESALASLGEPSDHSVELDALLGLSYVQYIEGDVEASMAGRLRALAIARESGDRRREVWAVMALSNQYQDLDEERAEFHRMAGLALARQLGDRRAEGISLYNTGLRYMGEGRMDEAWAQLEAALAIHREVGNRRSEGIVLGQMGVHLGRRHRPDEAGRHFEQALALHREIGNRAWEGWTVGLMGRLHLDQGRVDEARTHFGRALALARDVGEKRDMGSWLTELADVDATDPEVATPLLDEGEALLRDAGQLNRLAILLTVRAEVRWRGDDVVGALAALTEAQSIGRRGPAVIARVARVRALMNVQDDGS